MCFCIFASPVPGDVTVVDMCQGGRGSGWIINTGGTLSPGHSGCVGGWPRLSPSLTDPQLAEWAAAALWPSLPLSALSNCVLYPGGDTGDTRLPNCWPERRVTSSLTPRQWRGAGQSEAKTRTTDQCAGELGRRQLGRCVVSEPGRDGCDQEPH